MPDGPELTPPATAGFPALRDFPDRLSPVLVKELRQGLRGRMFVVPFLILQGLLILTCAEPGRSASVIFWHFILVMLIFLLPSRNLAALGEERDSNTLDTLILTRLTPWRIVWGKWCASVAQSALTAVAVAPYLLVHYLNAGSSIIGEVLLLLVLLFLSGAVAGVFTALSVLKSPLQRNGLALAVMFAVYFWICQPLIVQAAMGWNQFSLAGLCAVMIFSVWAALFSLWQAAANIAPAATNVTTPRRLTSLIAVLACTAVVASSSFRDGIAMSCLMVMLGAVSLVEMGEPLSPHPGIAAAFDRRGWNGRAAAVLFRPGWDSGVLFCVVLWGLAGFLTGRYREPEFLAIASLCFFPVTARLLLPARMRGGVAPMLLLALASCIARVILLAIDAESLRDSIAVLLPGFHDPARTVGNSYPAMTLCWAGLAVLLASASLLFRHPRPKR